MNGKFDPTVPLSFLLLGAWVSIGSAFGIEDDLATPSSRAPVHAHLFFWAVFAAILRTVILWFQTLAHAAKRASPDERVRWAIARAVLPPVAPYMYYFAAMLREPCERRTP